MKNFIILIIFSFGLSLYSGSELFPFGMNNGLFEKQYSLDDDEEYREKYKITMDLSAQAGIKWWRAQNAFRWYNIQPEDLEHWDFKTEDSLVKWTKERGLHLLPEIGFTADSARHPDTEGFLSEEKSRQYPPDPDYWNEYKKYIDTLVKRYKNDIKYWQFSNEPDGGGHTGFLGTPAQYIEMYESTRVALKAADSTAKIVGFDMCTPKDDFDWEYFDTTSNSVQTSDFGYMSWEDAIGSLIDSIGLDNIDVVSQHIYRGLETFEENIQDLRDIVGEDKHIWITEVGYMNSSIFKAKRGWDNPCSFSTFATYSPDSDTVFWDSVCISRDGSEHYKGIDTFLNVGDSVVLFIWGPLRKNTIVYNGGLLIYEDANTTDTVLAVGDTLRIFDYWAEETDNHHNPDIQASSYEELLNNTSLENIKIFFFCANNNIDKYYYPPQIGKSYDDKLLGYWRQRKHCHWSVIDTNDNPYPAYSTIQNHILPSYLDLDEYIDTNETKTYQAMDSISANDFRIRGNGSNGGKVAMEAGEKISLKPGFRVEAGGYFHGSTNPLYGGGTGLSTIKLATPKAIKTSGKEVAKDSIPKVFSCNQNYPNPFVRRTTIKYGLPKNSNVSLEIFNLAGQKVRKLVDAPQSAGYKSVSWDGRTSSGTQVPQGVYFYVFKAGDKFKKKFKMIMIK